MSEITYLGPGVVLRMGELFLKGGNRKLFIDALERNVRRALDGRKDVEIRRKHGRIFILGSDDDDLITRLEGVFGVANLSKIVFCKKDLDEITAAALELAKTRPNDAKTFRITARRPDKTFPHMSADIGRVTGAAVAVATGLGVDLTEFDYEIGVEVGLDWTFLWSETIPGAGGLPVGTSGKSLLLLSGGIDSPVAGHMMQKRGLELGCVYFHSYPYTSDGAKDKVIQLAKILARNQRKLQLAIVPFTKLQECFRDGADAKLLVILYRRAMLRIAEKLAVERRIRGLVTGESLGQVASQTLPNIAAIEDAIAMPVLRPLIGFDKSEVIELAKKINSYEISILPHDDCCSLFVPRHPETKANINYVRAVESRMEWHFAMEEAIENIEYVEL
jgi:tRNA uracil 4-sulfurtransferase